MFRSSRSVTGIRLNHVQVVSTASELFSIGRLSRKTFGQAFLKNPRRFVAVFCFVEWSCTLAQQFAEPIEAIRQVLLVNWLIREFSVESSLHVDRSGVISFGSFGLGKDAMNLSQTKMRL